QTEGALLAVVGKLGRNYWQLRTERLDTSGGRDKLFPFSSSRKRMTVVLRSSGGGSGAGGGRGQRVYCKGAAEIILSLCTHRMDRNGVSIPLSGVDREELHDIIVGFGERALRAVGIAHRDLPPGAISSTEKLVPGDVEKDLVLDAIVGIKDPVRGDVKHAVEQCQQAGIMVRMVTGDNIATAKAIAVECGIYDPNEGLAMEGPEFRKMTPKQLDQVLPRLQVLARSSPHDKYLLVTRLNGGALPKSRIDWEEMHPELDWEEDKDNALPGYWEEWIESRLGGGEVVGATGDGTNDAPALKTADVGLSMGLSGTDVAKDASDIVIMDDRFSSIVKAVLWGRSVFDNIRKFLQFQLTVNVVALTLTFLSAVSGYEPPLNAVMMLWVNLIMDTMGALALGTEPPTLDLLNRRPYKRNSFLVNRLMWRNILVQSAYQLGLLTSLCHQAHFFFSIQRTNTRKVAAAWNQGSISHSSDSSKICMHYTRVGTTTLRICSPFFFFFFHSGAEFYGVKDGSEKHFTILFNAFVFCQIFNEFNARSISNEWNIMKGLSNPMFQGVIIFTCLAQFMIVENGGDFTRTTPLTADEWITTVLMGALALPLGVLMRFLPPHVEGERNYAGYK
ncbi:unnamed protein product, partial [Discosporangium mesarthrocarpum]